MFADKRKSHRTLNTSIQERIHNMGKLLIVSISDHEEHILNKIMEIIADEPELDHISLPPSNASLSFPHLAGSFLPAKSMRLCGLRTVNTAVPLLPA